MRRFRLLNRLYAFMFGYFWLLCPCCGKYFGEHERGTAIWFTGYRRGKTVCYKDACNSKARERGEPPRVSVTSALERLQEIEDGVIQYIGPDGPAADDFIRKRTEFLLRAVRVYREIALENTISFSWAPSKRPVDKTFEERMTDNVQKPNS